MSIYKVAEAAGVSIATVSRVINDLPGVSEETAQNIRKIMEEMDYTPSTRRRGGDAAAQSSLTGKRIGFYLMELSRNIPYDHLLRGIAAASTKYNVDFHVSFIRDLDDAHKQIAQRRPDGLLLHGYCPPPERSGTMERIPSVWLMGNPIAPHWGDQVMPDNLEIGRMAAQYLVGRGHRHLLYFGLSGGWTMPVRAAAFIDAVDHLGATTSLVNPKRTSQPQQELLAASLSQLVTTYRESPERPTGLFVSEDWMLRDVYAALLSAGIRPGADVDILSCNNIDRMHYKGLDPDPATLDIQFEQIAIRGMERLLARIRGEDLGPRVRVLVEPTLVPAPAKRA